MIFKKIKPYTPSQRHLKKIKINNVTEKAPLLKNKIKYLKNNSGRNNTGKITVSHKGGGHKKKYRQLKFQRDSNTLGLVISIEYDPYRNTFISAVFNLITFQYYYILTPKNIRLGSIVKSGSNVIEPKLGFSMLLSKLPLGSFIHNVETKKRRGGQFIRSAGTFAQLIEKRKKTAVIRLNAQRNKIVPLDCFATLGTLSNEYSFLSNKGKAGRSRWLNIRPTVRGVAMNPIDHPNGGGEGKTSGIKISPWGKL